LTSTGSGNETTTNTSNERRCEARALKRQGAQLSGEGAALTRFTLVDLFADRTVRWPLIGSLLMMISLTFAFWGVSTFVPTYVGSIATKANLPAATWAGYAGLVTGIFGTLGFISLGFLADAFGRKPVTMLFYLVCLILTPVVYLPTWNIHALLAWVAAFGFFSVGIWAWAQVWLPDCFRRGCVARPSPSVSTHRVCSAASVRCSPAR
jgi:MFS family permease